MNSNQITPVASLSSRHTSLLAGALYLLTFVSIPTLSLYRPVHAPGYLLAPGSDSGIITGGILEIIVALTGIGTAVILYPVLKSYSQRAALGLVASRILEAATIFLGVVFLLAAVTLHQGGAGAHAEPVGRALVALYDRCFLVGQSLIPAFNDMLLGYLLYRSGLVPRALSLLAMIGALPLIAGFLGMMFGGVEQYSPLAGLAAVPVALFEFSLGLYLLINGFRREPAMMQADR